MKIGLLRVLIVAFFALRSASAMDINWDGVSGEVAFAVPESVFNYMRNTSKKNGDKFIINSKNNPFYLRADINGDGRIDYLVFVKNLANKKSGLLVCVKKDKCMILFAGVSVKSASVPGDVFDDLGEGGLNIDMWNVYEGGKIYQHPEALPPPKPMGEVIYIAKMESEGVFILWNGREYVVY